MKHFYWVFLFLAACSPDPSQNAKNEIKNEICTVSFGAQDSLKTIAMKAHALQSEPCKLDEEEILNLL